MKRFTLMQRLRTYGATLKTHPLRVGLSMAVRVDVSNTDGLMLSDAARTPTATQTDIFQTGRDAADARVRRIIASNGGRVSAAPRRALVATAAPVQVAAGSAAAASSVHAK